MPESSIVVKAEDRYSDVVKKMCDYTKKFSSNVNELEDNLKALSKNKYDLKLDLKQAQKELKAAEKQFDRTGAAADKLQLEAKQANYDNIRRNLDAVTKAAKDTERQIRSVAMDDSNFWGKLSAGEPSFGKSIKDAGLLSGVGNAASQIVTNGLESALGQPLAAAVNGALSSAVSGATMGMVAGPMGAAIGGLVGAAAGGISGIVTMEAAKDDAFKSYVQTSVEDQLAQQEQTLQSGSATAGHREQSRLAFVQRFGSEEAADDYLGQVKTMARNTNYTYDEIVGYSKSLLNSYEPDEVFSVLQTLSDASAGLSLGESDVNVMIQGLSRMRTTGKATQEYLNYFSERGVDVYAALADATGADKSQIAQMVSSGQISGETAAQAILDYINKTFGGLSENLAGTYDAMVNNMNDAQAEIDAAMGEGYNEARKEGIQAQQDWLNGDSGERVSEMYRSIGAFEASLENEKESLMRQYMDEAMDEIDRLGIDTSTEEGAAEAGRMLMEAKIKAQNEYNASEGAQLMLESELSLIQSVREDTALNADYYDAGYRLGQEFSKGRLAATEGNSQFASIVAGSFGAGSVADYSNIGGFATGLERVPYDNFPALLHEGERVLTASEARSYDGGSPVTITGNQFVVRQDSDVDAIAAALVEKIRMARLAGVT